MLCVLATKASPLFVQLLLMFSFSERFCSEFQTATVVDNRNTTCALFIMKQGQEEPRFRAERWCTGCESSRVSGARVGHAVVPLLEEGVVVFENDEDVAEGPPVQRHV